MTYYEIYIGSITVDEFIGTADSVEEAVRNFINQWPWEDEIPDDFEQIITGYCNAQLTGKII